jgi:hypothetical protein
MTVSYSSFKNNYINFNCEEYLSNIIHSNSYNFYSDFIKIYKEIENEDLKKPLFSQSTKFKKNPNNYKNYKYVKINRDKEEVKNTWVFENPKEENNKISIIIKTYLNKISEDTYKKISIDFMNELLNIKNPLLFDILSKEIFNKCIFDNKYRHLYINLCNKIWTNKEIHLNLVNIINDNNIFYWEHNDQDSEKNGPFTNESNVINDIFNKINFKKYFFNYIQKLYINKDIIFENLDEDEIFLKKKKTLLLVELIGIMYLEKYINFDIINIIIIDLLHINNFSKIQDIEYESLYNLLKLIKDKKNNYNSLIEHKNIFEEYIKIILELINNIELSKRSLFFMNETIDILKIFISNNLNINDKKIINDKNNPNTINIKNNVNNKNSVNTTNTTNNMNSNITDLNNKKIFIEKINNYSNNKEVLNIYNNLSNNSKDEVIYKIINNFISNKKYNENIINLLNDIDDSNKIFLSIDIFVNNIEDIMLDIPNANTILINLIENFKYDNCNKYIDILKNIINNESDDELDTNNNLYISKNSNNNIISNKSSINNYDYLNIDSDSDSD